MFVQIDFQPSAEDVIWELVGMFWIETMYLPYVEHGHALQVLLIVASTQ